MNTSFAKRVYALTNQIPKGNVSTYKHLADALNTKAYRAVGNALRNNPDAPRTPCHRVIKHDRTLGGYQGSNDSTNKRALLKAEGVIFSSDGRVDTSCVYAFSQPTQ